jgi:gas vesicle structural protein
VSGLSPAEEREITLLELLDRVIDRGVVLTGDVTISVADVDLVYLGLRVMLTSAERAEQMRAGLLEEGLYA